MNAPASQPAKRSLVLFGLGPILLILFLFSVWAFYNALLHPRTVVQNLTQAQLLDLVKAGRVSGLVQEPDRYSGVRTWNGTYTVPANSVPGTVTRTVPFYLIVSRGNPQFETKIHQAGYKESIPAVRPSHSTWQSVLYELPAILLLVGVLACLSILLWHMRARNRTGAPAFVSPDAVHRHLTVIYLIRSIDIILVVPILLFFLLFIPLTIFGFLSEINPFRRPPVYNEVFSVVMLIGILMGSAALIVKTLHRIPQSVGDFFRRFQEVNANNISNFCFIFAALAAYDFYHLMAPAVHK